MDEGTCLSQIIENISEGIISIDSQQRINIINRKAKGIFGIAYKYDIGHLGGRIEKGDILIIGDNSLGTDDGGLEGEDLKDIGISECIPQKASFVYIGIYGDDASNEYKYYQYSSENIISLRSVLLGMDISVSINFSNKIISIDIDDISIPYSFVKGIGHIVVLDGQSGELKFYQSKGYTIRSEDLKAILRGKNFVEKICGKDTEFQVEGEKINEVLNVSESINNLINCSKGTIVNFLNKYDDINGRPIIGSVYPLKVGETQTGAFLKFEDLSNVKEIMEERDSVLKKLHEIEDVVYDPFNLFVGESDKINTIKVYSKKAALSCANILILGENGTGKSILASMIHNYSNRSGNRFVELNCGAIATSLIESELFGYVNGAFTGAKKEGKKGLVEWAEGGTLFLDEISEIPVNIQVKLLDVIQNKRVTPVGGTVPIKVDVRIICATNRDLKKMVEERLFREDLYYRINVMPLTIPPLRERKEDLHYLIQFIIHKISKRDKVQYKGLSNDAFNKLYSYSFPGNVRELENIIERGLNISEDEYISGEDILIGIEKELVIKPLRMIIEEVERKTILNYMKRFNGNKSKVMESLKIKKTAFYDKLKKYNIE